MLFGCRTVCVVPFWAIALATVTVTRAWVLIPSNQNSHAMGYSKPVSCRSPSTCTPYSTTWSFREKNNNEHVFGNSCLHSSVVSPRRADVGGSIDDENEENERIDFGCEEEEEALVDDLEEQQEQLEKLFELLEAEPKSLLRFQNEDGTNVRGIYPNRSIQSGDVVLKIPVESCLIDDQTPSWLDDFVKDDPDRWATRLAASWIDTHLRDKIDDPEPSQLQQGHQVWCSLLPDAEFLKASLPVHWPETTVSDARSTALELAVDSAFFTRAEAVLDLVQGLQSSPFAEHFQERTEAATNKKMNELAHHALDLVQTRSCRLEDGSDDPRRAMAPIFDFLNHGSRNTASANAFFSLEEDEGTTRGYVVVCAMRDISQDEEVKIDYGASARPAWKCLLSYGFVPRYQRTVEDAEEGENLAEVYMKGVRYEVADDSVPLDMVANANPRPWSDEEDSELPENENVLTPDIALRIAERLSDAAFYLLLEPEQILGGNESNEDEEDPDSTPFEVISTQLAASLRWSQHKILLTCAAGLTHFAKEMQKEESSYQ